MRLHTHTKQKDMKLMKKTRVLIYGLLFHCVLADLDDDSAEVTDDVYPTAPIESSGWAIFGKFFVFAAVVASVVGYLRQRHTQKSKKARYEKSLA